MAITVITAENFSTEVTNSNVPVLIDFWASWCNPCRMLAPTIDEIATENPNIKVGKVNVDEQPDLAAKFTIMSIPTLLIFNNGNLINKAVGVQPKETILSLLP